MTKDEMVGQHHQFDGHEFEQTPEVGDTQGSLDFFSPWGRRKSNMTERLIIYSHQPVENANIIIEGCMPMLL